MPSLASDLAERLAQRAESVCRHYLSNGRRHGAYWLVGDIRNTPGRSLYVRLQGPETGRGAAGNWTDAATGEYGDLLDIIRQARGLHRFQDVADEARGFLNLPCAKREPQPSATRTPRKTAARRLYAMSQRFPGSAAEAYLSGRGVCLATPPQWLRFHPHCYYRPDDRTPRQSWPALIAAVTDLEHHVTGVHRTWLDPGGFDPHRLGKAPVEWPKRAMGDLLGHAVRYGVPDEALIAGEGLETTLSIASAVPALAVAAALSSAHLAALLAARECSTPLHRARSRSRRPSRGRPAFRASLATRLHADAASTAGQGFQRRPALPWRQRSAPIARAAIASGRSLAFPACRNLSAHRQV